MCVCACVLFICVDEQILQQLRKVFFGKVEEKIRGKDVEGPLTMEASRLSLLLLWQEIGLGAKTFERLALEASQELKDAKAVAGRAAVSCAQAFQKVGKGGCRGQTLEKAVTA